MLISGTVIATVAVCCIICKHKTNKKATSTDEVHYYDYINPNEVQIIPHHSVGSGTSAQEPAARHTSQLYDVIVQPETARTEEEIEDDEYVAMS